MLGILEKKKKRKEKKERKMNRAVLNRSCGQPYSFVRRRGPSWPTRVSRLNEVEALLQDVLGCLLSNTAAACSGGGAGGGKSELLAIQSKKWLSHHPRYSPSDRALPSAQQEGAGHRLPLEDWIQSPAPPPTHKVWHWTEW